MIVQAGCEVRPLGVVFHLAPTFIFVLLLLPSFISALSSSGWHRGVFSISLCSPGPPSCEIFHGDIAEPNFLQLRLPLFYHHSHSAIHLQVWGNVNTVSTMPLCLLCWINRSTGRNFNQVEGESDLFDLGCTEGLQEKDKRQQQQPIKCYPFLILNLVRHSLGGQTVFSHSILLPPASASPAPHTLHGLIWQREMEDEYKRMQNAAEKPAFTALCVLRFCVIAVDQLSLHTCAHRAWSDDCCFSQPSWLECIYIVENLHKRWRNVLWSNDIFSDCSVPRKKCFFVFHEIDCSLCLAFGLTYSWVLYSCCWGKKWRGHYKLMFSVHCVSTFIDYMYD